VQHVDPRFERIARRLSSLELRSGAVPPLDGMFDTSDKSRRGGDAFVDTYSVDGIRRVLDEYGLADRLRAQDLGDVHIDISREDAFRHRLRFLLPAPVRPGGETAVMDLHLHLCTLGIKGDQNPFDVVVVDWLLMQNPRRHFHSARPRLPGQTHPGTGLGRAVGQLLVLLCHRVARAGLLVVPERFHLAELYRAGGYQALESDDEGTMDDLLEATRSIGFAARAWAVERDCVVDTDGQPVRYQPHPRLLPVVPTLAAALNPGGRLFRGLFRNKQQLHLDRAKLVESLRRQPVEGMDPDDLRR
jgi:hypothetical protein